MDQNNSSPPLNTIPPPEVVRKRLTETLRDATLLRALLRVSERAAREMAERKEGKEVSRGS